MFFAAVALSLLIQSEIVITTKEPVAPSLQIQRLESECGNHRLIVTGYGLSRPIKTTPQFYLDGNLLKIGEDFSRFLTTSMATYRFSVICPREGNDVFLVYAYRSVGSPRSEPEYSLRTLIIFSDGAVVSSDEHTLNASDFWFE